jgi:hypothetical protein
MPKPIGPTNNVWLLWFVSFWPEKADEREDQIHPVTKKKGRKIYISKGWT